MPRLPRPSLLSLSLTLGLTPLAMEEAGMSETVSALEGLTAQRALHAGLSWSDRAAFSLRLWRPLWFRVDTVQRHSTPVPASF